MFFRERRSTYINCYTENIMNRIIADTKEQLQEELKKIDITVPPRGEGRTTGHCETWSICRFLASLSKAKKLSYPLVIEKRPQDKPPDYQLNMGEINIGIEITEAISEDLAQFEAIHKNIAIDISLFKPDIKHKSKEEFEDISKSKIRGEGWDGDGMEIDWAKAVYTSINKKIQKLGQPHFEKLSQNWLLIYDNLWPAEDKKIDIINQMMAAYQGESNFDNIFIESSDVIIKLSNKEIITLYDLWKKRITTQSRGLNEAPKARN